MPESTSDRPSRSHSTVFLFSKRKQYFYDLDAIRTPYTTEQARPLDDTLGDLPPEAPRGPDGRRVTAVKGKENSHQHRDGERWPNPDGANARSVWTIPAEPAPFQHFATWPKKLVARMIQAGTRAGDTVLDPFAGSGTTLLVARSLGRRSIGIELNPDYCKLAAERTQQLSLLA
jgi:tRNA/tmRNA/rRNA uracil-C5-methylase (TrmA/RlmC/RlmD family)